MATFPSGGPIVVIGARGQVGRALLAVLGERAKGLSRVQADLSRPERLGAVLARLGPSAVFNAAAYTDVDRAEAEESLAETVNGEAPGAIARYCAARDIPFVHFSTDYVFSGAGERPWRESDAPAPVNAYGRGKWLGEREVAAAGGRWLIFRTSWVYDACGRNFVTTMVALARERDRLEVVDDQYGAPTYAPSLAAAAVRALDVGLAGRDFPSAIYHLCGAGACSWFEFAGAIFASARRRGARLRLSELKPVPTRAYPTPAPRPANGRLSTAHAARALGVSLPAWEVDLERCLDLVFAPDRAGG